MSESNKIFSFLPAGGRTGALVRAFDWSKTSLGPAELWPESLKITLGILFGSRHAMLLWWGPDLVQFYNDGYLPSFGKGKHPLALGQKAKDCWPEIWPIIYPQMRQVLDEGKPSWNENQYIPFFRNGRIEDAYWTYSYSPVYECDGKISGVLAVCTETTQQVLATRDLEKSQKALSFARQELESFLLQAPVAIAILSGPEHTYTFLNPAFMSLVFGNRPDTDFLGKTVRDAVPEIKDQGFYQILDGVYQTGQSYSGKKLKATIKQADGREKELYVNFTYQAKRNHAGKIDGIVAVIYEVTDQVNEQKEIEQLAENLRAAIVSRDVFLGIASHELNTPLTSLKLQTQMSKRLLEKQGALAFTPEKLKKLLDNILVQSDRLGRLVNDVLDVSRISTGKLSVKLSAVNLSNLVRDVLERFQAQFELAGCNLSLVVSEEIVTLLDAARIEQVVTNLITNALKYAPGKPLLAKVERVKSLARVSLKDHGEGIAPQNLERIFGRFERAISANQVSGLGLGLFICKQIIQEHRGEIYVESELGRGATFIFELPLITEPTLAR